MTDILSSGPDQLPAADVIGLCAIILLRRIGDAAEIARARRGSAP
jgi:hypothetical protein